MRVDKLMDRSYNKKDQGSHAFHARFRKQDNNINKCTRSWYLQASVLSTEWDPTSQHSVVAHPRPPDLMGLGQFWGLSSSSGASLLVRWRDLHLRLNPPNDLLSVRKQKAVEHSWEKPLETKIIAQELYTRMVSLQTCGCSANVINMDNGC